MRNGNLFVGKRASSDTGRCTRTRPGCFCRCRFLPQLVRNQREVALIFSVPLEAFLYHDLPAHLKPIMHIPSSGQRTTRTPLAGNKDEPGPAPGYDAEESEWHSVYQVDWLGERLSRHTFWDVRNPIRGLTRYEAS